MGASADSTRRHGRLPPAWPPTASISVPSPKIAGGELVCRRKSIHLASRQQRNRLVKPDGALLERFVGRNERRVEFLSGGQVHAVLKRMLDLNRQLDRPFQKLTFRD